jgi:hypothetical protein
LGLDALSELLVTPVIQSVRVLVFLKALAQLRAERPLLRRLDGNVKATDLWLGEVDALNWLVAQTRQALAHPEFKERMLKGQSVANRRHKEASAYLEDILRQKGDLLVIPLEIKPGLNWGLAAGLREAESKLPAIVERFNVFKRQARHRAEWAHVVGFVGRWERSELQGLYARVLFFLESARVSDPGAAAEAIGKLWVKFTEGKGSFDPAYFISTDAEMLIPFRQVCRGSAKHRKELLEVALPYFTKQELVFRDPDLDLEERFFRGERASSSARSMRGPRAVRNNDVNSDGVEQIKAGERYPDDSLDDAEPCAISADDEVDSVQLAFDSTVDCETVPQPDTTLKPQSPSDTGQPQMIRLKRTERRKRVVNISVRVTRSKPKQLPPVDSESD